MRLKLFSTSTGALSVAASDIDRSPTSDYWYQSLGRRTSAGNRISEDTALAVSAFYAGVRLISETLGALPMSMFRRTATGKTAAPNHPLHETLHDQANEFQTAQEWRELTTAHAIMRGDGISLKVAGTAGDNSFNLIPLNPSHVEITVVDSSRLAYTLTRQNGQKVPIPADQIFRMRAFSDRVRGLGVVGLARESLGLALATEEHGATFFGSANTPSGAVTHPKTISGDAQEKFEKTWQRTYGGGNANAHSVLFLEEGMTWQTLGLSNEDSQFLQTRQFQVNEIARWLRLPPHMLGMMENAIKANVEEESRNFLLFSLFPWVKRLEHSVRRDLIVAKRVFFSEVNLDALMRADLKTRMQSYVAAINNGILSPNEVRELENRNPYPGGDNFHMPMNLTTVGSDGNDRQLPSSDDDNGNDNDNDNGNGSRPPQRRRRLTANTDDAGYIVGVMDRALSVLPEQARVSQLPAAVEQLQAIVERAADGIVAKEIRRISAKAPRYAANAAGWADWVSTFYDSHAGFVSDVLAIDRDVARAYCDEQREDVLAHGVRVLDRWRFESPVSLAALALPTADDVIETEQVE